METERPYNPLDKNNLARSVVGALLIKSPIPLQQLPLMHGAGIYAIYYRGDFEFYRPLAELHAFKPHYFPIYVGKAIPAGGRKGASLFDSSKGLALFQRLNEHAKSIQSAENLLLEHFECRYLVTDDIWIPLGESLLISGFRPLWNLVIDGFGNHDPGKGRYEQKIAPWDILHPGREWAKRLKDGIAMEMIHQNIEAHFGKNREYFDSLIHQNNLL